MRGSLRVKISTILLVIICIFSIYEPIDINRLQTSPRSESALLMGLDKVSCLNGNLPENVQQFGFYPPVSLVMQPPPGSTVISDDLRQRLFILRYALLPKLVSNVPDGPWVIAYYNDYETGRSAVKSSGFQIEKDCGNGIFLLKR